MPLRTQYPGLSFRTVNQHLKQFQRYIRLFTFGCIREEDELALLEMAFDQSEDVPKECAEQASAWSLR